ncbi:MAG: SGNH hydrolase, partial [Actinomycetales bacterium]|nr:SGNH hydrolase [Actinomycetales bacterium]
MRIKRPAHAVLGALVLSTAVLVAAPSHAESNGGVRIMPLGDSITDGLTVPGGYRIALWQHLTGAGATVDFVGSMSNGPGNLGDHDHEGHSGWTISQIDTNIVTWLRTYTPRTVLLHIGTNDMIGGNASTAATRLSTLIDRILTTAPDTYVFVATIIPLSLADSQVRQFNAAVPGIVQARAAAGRRVYLVDMYSALTMSDLADGVHPNAGGYTKMANAWWAALQRVPASYSSTVPTTTTTTTSTTRPTTTTSTTRPTTTTTTTTTRPTTTTTTTTTTRTTPPTTTTTTTTSQGSGGCTAAYSVQSQWPGGFVANVNVTAGSSAINGWRVTMTLPSG